MIQGVVSFGATATPAGPDVMWQVISGLAELLAEGSGHTGPPPNPAKMHAAVMRIYNTIRARAVAGNVPVMTVADFKALTRAVGRSPDWF